MKWWVWNRYPYVTGTSVIGIKYKDGILIAADMGGLNLYVFLLLLLPLFLVVYFSNNVCKDCVVQWKLDCFSCVIRCRLYLVVIRRVWSVSRYILWLVRSKAITCKPPHILHIVGYMFGGWCGNVSLGGSWSNPLEYVLAYIHTYNYIRLCFLDHLFA